MDTGISMTFIAGLILHLSKEMRMIRKPIQTKIYRRFNYTCMFMLCSYVDQVVPSLTDKPHYTCPTVVLPRVFYVVEVR